MRYTSIMNIYNFNIYNHNDALYTNDEKLRLQNAASMIMLECNVEILHKWNKTEQETK